MGSIIADVPDEEIVRLCHVNPRLNRIQYGRCFERIFDDVIVKFGWSVTEDEAKNQKYARILCNETKIMVPEVYRYFAWSGLGFIVMEFVHGEPMERILLDNHPNLIQNLAKEIFALATKRPADFPGPRNCGIPKGYLFSEDGAGRPLNTIDTLNSWLNERARLTISERRFNFQLADCVFCHMDLSRRNILVLDHHFCLLDWEFAGFYPKMFEKYSILFNGQKEGNQFAGDLSKALDLLYENAGVEASDERMIERLNRIYRNNESYSLCVPDRYIKGSGETDSNCEQHRFTENRHRLDSRGGFRIPYPSVITIGWRTPCYSASAQTNSPTSIGSWI